MLRGRSPFSVASAFPAFLGFGSGTMAGVTPQTLDPSLVKGKSLSLSASRLQSVSLGKVDVYLA